MGQPKGVVRLGAGTDLLLAAGAVVGSAAGKQNPVDEGSATAAGLSGAEVDAVLELEESADAVGVDIIRDRGAAEADGMLEDLAEGLAEPLEFGAGEAAGGAARADSGMEKALVGIDVAHAGEEGLVEQRSLDGQFAAAEESGKVAGGDGERFGAGGVKGGGADELTEFETAEAAGIDEAKLAAALEAEADVGVGDDRLVGRGNQQAAGHSQMDDPLCIWLRVCVGLRDRWGLWRRGRAELADDVLAGSMNPENDAAG